jgi:PII-like signaling protein
LFRLLFARWRFGPLHITWIEHGPPRDAVLFRIFFGEADKYRALPLHEAIVLKAREMHLTGATVLRGQIGFGHSTSIHATKILRLS